MMMNYFFILGGLIGFSELNLKSDLEALGNPLKAMMNLLECDFG